MTDHITPTLDERDELAAWAEGSQGPAWLRTYVGDRLKPSLTLGAYCTATANAWEPVHSLEPCTRRCVNHAEALRNFCSERCVWRVAGRGNAPFH
jgi:hypothetical protein